MRGYVLHVYYHFHYYCNVLNAVIDFNVAIHFSIKHRAETTSGATAKSVLIHLFLSAIFIEFFCSRLSKLLSFCSLLN